MEGTALPFFNEDILHDIKNPVSVIYAVVKTLSYIKDDSAQFLNSLNILEKNVILLSKLTDDITDCKNLFEGSLNIKRSQVEIVNITEKLIECIAPIGSGKNVNIILRTNFTKYDTIFSDSYVIERIIRNLVSNGIKYSPNDSAIEVRLFKKGNTIFLSVRDYGKGIADEEAKHIFEKNYSSHDKLEYENSDGLGLFIVKLLSQKLSGDTFINQKDVGVEIGIYFPL